VTAAGVVTTVAGLAGINGSADGSGPDALFRGPASVAVDPEGNTYVADQVNNTIRKITPTGVVSTLAGRAGIPGSVNATGTAASFDSPVRVAVDSAGNVYVTEWLQNQIRQITPAGKVSTVAILQDADFLSGLAVDPNGNIYAADFFNHTIWQVDPAGKSTILAGTTELAGSADGVGADATFNYPCALALDPSGNLYVTDFADHTIRKVTPEGRVTTLAGLPGSAGSADGVGNQARFWGPMGLAVDRTGNVYVADTFNNTIRKVTPAGVVTTLGGRAGQVGTEDGTGSAARFDSPTDVAVDAVGVLYVADYYFSTLRKGTATLALVSPAAIFRGNIQQFDFTLVGPVTQSVVIEASTNLTEWIPISTNALTAPVHFSDPIGAILRNRFYRAHSR
jgi:sugar lactone lactonase YvrE